MELTMNFSDIEKMKYLNGILLIQFKEYIQTKQDFEMTENDYIAEDSQESNVDQILNEENFEEITEKLSTNKDIKMTENKYFENSEKSNSDQILIEETFEETMEEISTNEDIQMPIENELDEDISSFCKKEIIEFESNSIETTHPKTFLCYICNKEYNMNFHLKRHIKNIHENRKSYNSPNNTIQYDQKPKESEIAAKSISNANNLKRHEGQKDYMYDFQKGKLKTHIQTIREVHKDYKCESCDKSFLNLRNLERHLHTVHDGYRDYKCTYCGKSLTDAGHLKKHIHTIHEGHKD